MAAAFGSPFTWAQMKELERQAIIYKYIMASLPVPPHLLSPITHFSTWGLGFSKSKHEAEPGRCKRTDGKKWRCSKDVAPHHKYCEHHLHRSRPRSRKPVEVQTRFISKKAHHHHRTLPPDPTRSTVQSNETPQIPDKTNGNVSVSSYKEPSRGLDWSMEGEMLAMDDSEHPWKNLLQSTDSAFVFRPSCSEMSQNLFSYTDFGAPEIDQQNYECSLFLNPELISLEEEPEIETPWGFIDAWSNESSVSSKTLLPSSLELSMAMVAGEALDEEMGLGVGDWEHETPQVSSWLRSVSWGVSAPGGPLAEMLLQSSNSSYACNEDSAMPFQWLH